MGLQFELSGSQIDGARDYQEDAFMVTNLTDAEGNSSALIIIADGMGGHAAGNVASNMAVQAFNKHVLQNYPTDNPAEILYECVIKANNSIKETVKETPALAGMGCTIVAAILENGKLWWASVGDSHLYLVRNKTLQKVNADHSYGGFLDKMAAAGTPVEPEPGLARNMLMSAVTGDEIDEIDVSHESLNLQAGDRILLCSDGMDTLSEGKKIQFSDWSSSPKECVEALLSAVKDAGMPKQDNTTIVVADVKEKAVTAAPAPEPKPQPSAVAPAPVAAVPPVWQAPSAAPAEKKGNTGMMLAIAAAVLLAVGIGGYFAFSGNTAAPLESQVAEQVEIAAGPDAETLPAELGQSSADEEDVPVEQTVEETAATDPIVAAVPPESVTEAANEFSDRLKDGSSGPEMVVVAAGSFEMGSPGSSGNADERPRHTVNIDQFAISKYEVTFSQYEKFARAIGRKIPDNLYMDKDTHPVIFVSWDDAFYYSKWLSEQTGQTYSLPSESQWEYAAGSGARSTFWWGYEEEPNRAHCFGCGSGLDPRKPTKVGSFQPNKFGIHDTSGNVSEWVRDCWHDNYNNAPTTDEVWEGGDCITRVVRGGSYSSPPQSIRHSKRDKFKSDALYDNIGIRLVRELN